MTEGARSRDAITIAFSVEEMDVDIENIDIKVVLK